MLLNILKGKIHRVRVTQTELEYEGSITIDETLAKKAGILLHEKVLVADMRNGERFETYVIFGAKNSGTICINGAAAHLCEIGDEVIIMAFAVMDEKKAKKHLPSIVKVNKKNKPL